MRVFVDTNVLMDVFLERRPFLDDAVSIVSLAESGRLKACISAISYSNCWYLLRKQSGRGVADKNVRRLRDVFTTVDLTSQILNQAIDSGFADFEDAIQFHSAIRSGAACIITRNADHFPREPLPVLSPPDFLAHYSLK